MKLSKSKNNRFFQRHVFSFCIFYFEALLLNRPLIIEKALKKPKRQKKKKEKKKKGKKVDSEKKMSFNVTSSKAFPVCFFFSDSKVTFLLVIEII